jgi:hypothetical protein
MRGLKLSDVHECGMYQKYQITPYRILGLLLCLAPWVIALTIWLIVK